MKTLFEKLVKHFNSHKHAASQAIAAYVRARTTYLKGCDYTPFPHGPEHNLP